MFSLSHSKLEPALAHIKTLVTFFICLVTRVIESESKNKYLKVLPFVFIMAKIVSNYLNSIKRSRATNSI